MYTEEDLRTAFGELAREAPDTDGVLARLGRLRRRRTLRRRTLGMAAVAVLVASVAAGSVLVANPDRPVAATAPPADTHAERFRFPFQVGELPGYQVVPRFLSGTGDSVAWITTPANLAADLTAEPYALHVFREGGYDPTADRAGEPVQVNGKPGFYRDGMSCRCSSGVGVPGIAWEYAPDSWALVQFPAPAASPTAVVPPDIREVLMGMATAVRFDRTTPLPLPFRIGYLPAGLRPSLSNTASVFPVASRLSAHLLLEGPGDRSLSVSVTPVHDDGRRVGEPVVLDHLDGGKATVGINVGPLTVQLAGGGYPIAELKRVAASIQPASDVTDPRTWLDAEDAVPLR